jgi:hypothetical protein
VSGEGQAVARSSSLRVIILFLAWLAAFGGGYVIASMTLPTDFGFTRGLNRLTPIFWGHVIGVVFAVASWVSVRADRAPSAALAFLGRIPAYAMILEVLVLIAIIVYATMTVPP